MLIVFTSYFDAIIKALNAIFVVLKGTCIYTAYLCESTVFPHSMTCKGSEKQAGKWNFVGEMDAISSNYWISAISVFFIIFIVKNYIVSKIRLLILGSKLPGPRAWPIIGNGIEFAMPNLG